MKAIFENVSNQTTIRVFEFETSHFEFKWHYHPEYELTLITKGKGMRFVGDNYQTFEKNDLVLLGSGIPHTWANEMEKNKNVSAVVIQFSEEFISNFISIDDFISIKKLLQSSSNGLVFQEKTKVINQIKLLPKQNGVQQITALLTILDELTKLSYKTLASAFYDSKINSQNKNRITIVIDYIKENSNKNIAIDEVASLIQLSVSAFCKFFKKTTHKTFSDYLNEIRIGNACYLLSETDKPIYQIAHEIGFENQAYFNRVFLKKKNCSPKEFRQKKSDIAAELFSFV
jgi:AraC-like DNA-binding protein